MPSFWMMASVTCWAVPPGMVWPKPSTIPVEARGLPSRAMVSLPGTALSPSRATRPLTVTRPAAMSSSALRREATPLDAKIF